jgi:anti-sigma28 factor (negative regulator of flagellin synthesis)
MKGITSNPALDAYQRMAVTQVGAPRAPQKAAASEQETTASAHQQIAKVSISSEARQLAVGSTQGALDPDKVNRLKAALDANQIQFDSAKIAERLVAALG